MRSARRPPTHEARAPRPKRYTRACVPLSLLVGEVAGDLQFAHLFDLLGARAGVRRLRPAR
eukprot:6062628-Alexandrium_andersonii.AAC.1